jgi:hypothetical protein
MLAMAGLVMACGGEERPSERAAAASDEQEVAAVIRSLRRAVVREDYASVCSALLSAGVRRRAGGSRGCHALLRSSAGGVHRPQIRIRSISVRANRATAKVTTSSAGQRAAPATIELVREAGLFRINSVAGP